MAEAGFYACGDTREPDLARFCALMRIHMNYYTDLDPGSGNSPYGSKEKHTIFILFTKIQGWEFALSLICSLLICSSLICSSLFCSFALSLICSLFFFSFALRSFPHLLFALLGKIAQFKEHPWAICSQHSLKKSNCEQMSLITL